MSTFWGGGLRREDSAKLDAPTAAGGRPAGAEAPRPRDGSGSAAAGVAATATGKEGDEPGVQSLTFVKEGSVEQQASGSGSGGTGDSSGEAEGGGALAKLRSKLRKKTSLRAVAKVASLRPKTLKAGPDSPSPF